jgi:hypothetical protein
MLPHPLEDWIPEFPLKERTCPQCGRVVQFPISLAYHKCPGRRSEHGAETREAADDSG